MFRLWSWLNNLTLWECHKAEWMLTQLAQSMQRNTIMPCALILEEAFWSHLFNRFKMSSPQTLLKRDKLGYQEKAHESASKPRGKKRHGLNYMRYVPNNTPEANTREHGRRRQPFFSLYDYYWVTVRVNVTRQIQFEVLDQRRACRPTSRTVRIERRVLHLTINPLKR